MVTNRVLHPHAAPGSGYGLVGMRERMASSRGVLRNAAEGHVFTRRATMRTPRQDA
ncbi:MAG: hypothetical protein QM286_08350 [Acidobacteriota bacterium]|nr:hypothetical protein [Acidobacteriota bacterium]NLH68933.1 hypothetical protein [Brooklawnia sp.]